MFKILDWYIGRTIIATSALCLTTLIGLSAIIKYVEQLRKVGRGTYDLLDALYFVVLSVPREIELFFPIAALLGALIGLGMLAASSELVVMQASGFSKLDIGLSVLKTAVPLMIIVMILGEWGAPQAQKLARDSRAEAIAGGEIVSVRNGVWAKDGNNFIFIGQVNDGDVSLRNVTIYRFNDTQNLNQIITAHVGHYQQEKEYWLLGDIQITEMAGDIQISSSTQDNMEWKSTLTPDKLAVVTVKPEELSLSGLYEYVGYLKASEQDSSKYNLAFWRKMFQPLSIAVMMLLALSFIFGPLRSVTMGARILTGVVAGFIFYFFSEVFGPMSLVYKIPPVVGALLPSLLFLCIAIILMRRKL